MKKTGARMIAALLSAVVTVSACAVASSALEPWGNGVEMRKDMATGKMWITNDPEYSFSEAYKSSVWYDNFDGMALTDNHRNNVLRVAISQLGYHEGNQLGDFDGGLPEDFDAKDTKNNNHMEYGRLMVQIADGTNYNDNHYDWCACFINWCLNQARVDYTYGEMSCKNWVKWLKANNTFEDSNAYGGKYVPKPADMIFFNWYWQDEDTPGNTYTGHIGFVLYATDTDVYTIEGNSGDEVKLRSYSLDAPEIVGYGTPAYVEGNEPTIDFSKPKGACKGRYIVKDRDAIIFSDAADDSEQLAAPSIGTQVEAVDVSEGYLKVVFDGEDEKVIGYMKKDALMLFTPSVPVSFRVNGKDAGTFYHDIDFCPDEVPKKDGYNGTWNRTWSADGGMVMEAVYSPITYTVTFVADGVNVGTAEYTVESGAKDITLPEVPKKDGYTGVWSEFIFKPENQTVTAVYTKSEENPAKSQEPKPTEKAPDTDNGCNGSIASAAVGILVTLCGAGVILIKKREK